jgi:hypothetical protein
MTSRPRIIRPLNDSSLGCCVPGMIRPYEVAVPQGTNEPSLMFFLFFSQSP